jgi:hypothetical protein
MFLFHSRCCLSVLGLEQDMLGFRVNFITQDYIILKVGRPNEKKQWVENIDKVTYAIDVLMY